MTQPAVQVRAGTAVAAVAVAPGTLRVERPLAGGRIRRTSGRRPRLGERSQRQERREAAGQREDAKRSSHAADYMAASRSRRYFSRSGSARLASSGSLAIVTTPSEAVPPS